MKTFVITFLIGLSMLQLCRSQPVQHSVPLDIMTTALNRSSLDSVPLKVSLPDDSNVSQLTFQVSTKESGEFFITGLPYDSIEVQVPAEITVLNQYGERAEMQGFQLKYSNSEEISVLEVLSPVGCVTLQIPETGRIDLRLSGKMVSNSNLRGIYTGSIRFDCKPE